MPRIARFWLLGGVALSLFSTAHAFYLPGAAPHDYHEGEEVDLFVNTLTPMIAGDDHAKLVSFYFSRKERLDCSVLTRRLHPEITHKLYV